MDSGSWRVWGKSAGEDILGTLAGVSSKQPIGDGDVLLSASLLLQFLRHRCWGFIIHLEDMSSPLSETEWANRFMGLFVHTTSPRVG
jgi:hypothetical protein